MMYAHRLWLSVTCLVWVMLVGVGVARGQCANTWDKGPVFPAHAPGTDSGSNTSTIGSSATH
jgi:hypothetical protein